MHTCGVSTVVVNIELSNNTRAHQLRNITLAWALVYGNDELLPVPIHDSCDSRRVGGGHVGAYYYQGWLSYMDPGL